MNGSEINSIDVLRAELNGKLDVILERTSSLKDRDNDHEARIRRLEDLDIQSIAVELKEMEIGLQGVNRRMWMAIGALGLLVIIGGFVANAGLIH